jgi:hypothetical protein
MKSIKVSNGKFEAKLEILEDGRVKVEFIIPEASENFNPDDYYWLVDKMHELTKNKKDGYSVEYQGIDIFSNPV